MAKPAARQPRRLTKETRIKHEVARLRDLFADMGESRLRCVENLIARCAFYAISLEDLEQTINTKGYIEEYKNGENQHGKKRSSEADLHVAMYKNYLAGVKQLVDLLPNDQDKPSGDELEEFVGRR